MIFYLAAIALVNIGVGFALARFVLPAGRKQVEALATEHHEQPLHAPIESYHEEPVEEEHDVATAPLAAAPAPAPTVAAAPSPAPAAPTAEAPEVEENLLAGINEFRNQLAQMKDPAEPEVAATPEPALAAAKG